MEWISRVLFTPQQKAELWEHWKSGQCIASDCADARKAEQERGLSDLGR